MAEGDPDEPPLVELPIRSTEPMATQSRQMLMIADQLGLLTYRWPVDFRDPRQVEQLKDDLGGGPHTLPQNDALYYLVYLNTQTGRQAVLVLEGEVRAFVAALAIKAGREAADRIIYYEGLLPT